jgi:hypothetical protein
MGQVMCRGAARTVIALAALACASPERPAWTSAAARVAPLAGPACAGCHAEVVDEWTNSLHHASFRDPDFQLSLREEPLDFCVRCHAPLASTTANARLLDEGIGCQSCHEGSGRHAAHPLVEKPTTRACCGCHEFAFPGRDERMQRTVAEHAASPFANVSCTACHMPAAATHTRSHRFAASRDAPALRAALDVEPLRRAPDGFELRVRSVGVGHAFPTGDLFRRVRVRLWCEDREGKVLSDDEESLTRVFSDAPERQGSTARVEVRDARIAAGETRTLHFAVPEVALVHRAHLVVTYDRVAAVRAGISTLFGSSVLFDTTQEFQP